MTMCWIMHAVAWSRALYTIVKAMLWIQIVCAAVVKTIVKAMVTVMMTIRAMWANGS